MMRLPGRMGPAAGGDPTNSRLMERTMNRVPVVSKTMTMRTIWASGEKSGANTGTSSTQSSLSFMGLNRLEDEDDEPLNGGVGDGYLPRDAWHKLARRAECCFMTAPSFHYM
ncbi:hypothetical protein GOODEAATRI_015268 [Goodea atripinnis]|uniref:Uncharacterized protein n=1 Tax=Goodea atripinnis TaxID=208336 RepID=A0ABV0NUU2_9TELE